ncbi:hypothetical protein MTO96_051327 [Rhipicephalus appendiculatus]
MFLYEAVTEALGSIKLQRWIDACMSTLLQGDPVLLVPLTAFFLSLSVLLWTLLQWIAHLPQRRQREDVRVRRQRRYLTAFTDTEEDAGLALRRRNRSRPRRSQHQDVIRSGHGLNGLQTVNDRVDAARVIQRWFRTEFKPRLAARNILRPLSPVEPWEDRDAGAVVVARVDHDLMSAIGQPGELCLVDVQSGELRTAPDALPADDADDTSSHGPPRIRRAATISSSRLFLSRKRTDGLSA